MTIEQAQEAVRIKDSLDHLERKAAILEKKKDLGEVALWLFEFDLKGYDDNVATLKGWCMNSINERREDLLNCAKEIGLVL